MRATRWLVTGQAVAEVEHPQPPLLQVAATAPRRLKCLLRSERETPPHPHARRRLLLQAGILLLPSPSCLLRRHVFSLAGGTPAPPVAFLFTKGRAAPWTPC